MEQQKSFKDKTKITVNVPHNYTKQNDTRYHLQLQKDQTVWTFLKSLFSRTEWVFGLGCVRRKRLFSSIPPSPNWNDYFCVQTFNKTDAFPLHWVHVVGGVIHRLEVAALSPFFSQTHDWSQKVDVLCVGSPTGWHHGPLGALHKLNSQIFTLMTHH